MTSYLIIGASRGLGKAFVDGLPVSGDRVFTVSRQSLKSPDHIQADLRQFDAAELIERALSQTPIDVLIYNAGIWEETDFEQTNNSFLVDIINVNLTNAMLVTQAVLPHLRQGKKKKVIFIGSTAGLENYPTTSVAYAAAKFGLRGLTNALREQLRQDDIAVTCISPGSMATDIDWAAGEQAALDKYNNKRMPVTDIVTLVKTLIDLSPAACAKEIVLPALYDKYL